METTWSRFKSVYPYTPSRYEGVRGDDDVEKLKQPLIDRDEYDSDDNADGYEENPLDEEAGLLSSYDSNSDRDQRQYDPHARASWKQQQQQRQSGYGSGFMASVEPKFLRSISKISELAASAFKTSPLSSLAATSKAKGKEDYYGASNSAGMISSIRSMVKTRRKTETMEDITEKALARIAMLTLACTVLLILGVSAHAS